jgi:hypothetical protein
MELVRAMSTIIPNCNSVDLSATKIDNTKFSKRFDDAVQKYPMLKVIANMGYYGGVSQNDVKIVVDYIDTIESAENMSNILSRI